MKAMFASLAALLTSLCSFGAGASSEFSIDPAATVEDSASTIMGVNHIGLSVKDLDRAVAFYQRASGFEVIRREAVRDSPEASTLFGRYGVEYDIAVLKAPNMLFELIEFRHNAERRVERMPVNGPGMTHTCFQTASNNSGYERFRNAGAWMLSRGNEPVDLGGYGVTYAYGYDPSGNMLEMEQLDPGPLAAVPTKGRWISEGHSMWMTQVALVTHDLDRLVQWYQRVLAFPPHREGDYADHPRLIEVADEDGLSLRAAWFVMAKTGKSLELWQMRVPETQEYRGKRDVTGFGYSYSLEVGDIRAEVERMQALGVEFVSGPVLMEDYWQVYAHDIDGNVFALRQWVDPETPLSVAVLDH